MDSPLEFSQVEPMMNAIRFEVARALGAGGLRFATEDRAHQEEASALAVEVIYTTDAGTRGALAEAWALAQGLSAHVRLIFTYAVPYTLPLTAPAVSLPFLQAKLASLANGFSGEACVNIYLCREPLPVLEDVLPPSSLVVLGGRKRWWRTKEQQLEKKLQKLGHRVIFAESR
jgi:hypothetical protein